MKKWVIQAKDSILKLYEYKFPDLCRKVFFFLSLFVVFLAMYVLNMQQPLLTDDWEYSFVHRWYDVSDKTAITYTRVASFKDILDSQYEHYYQWGGRSVNHFIAQVLLWMGEPYNKILNAIAYVLLTCLIYLYCRAENQKYNLSAYWLINILIFFFLPVIGQTILWITGSSNYLWGMLILLAFLFPYMSYYRKGEQEKFNMLLPVLMLIGGIVAGWTNENTVAAVITLLIFYLIYLKIKKVKIPFWMYCGLIGLMVGFIIMIAAPGNYVRYEATLESLELENTSRIKLLIGQLAKVLSGIFFYMLGLISIYLLSLVFYKCQSQKDNKNLILSIVLFVTSLLAAFAMTFSLAFPERAWFGIVIFMVIAVVILINNLDFSIPLLRGLRAVILSVSLIALCGYYVSGYKDLARTKRITEKREQIVLEGKKKGIKDFVFKNEITSKSRINNVYEFSDDADNWINSYYCRYHGINSVRVALPGEVIPEY